MDTLAEWYALFIAVLLIVTFADLIKDIIKKPKNGSNKNSSK